MIDVNAAPPAEAPAPPPESPPEPQAPPEEVAEPPEEPAPEPPQEEVAPGPPPEEPAPEGEVAEHAPEPDEGTVVYKCPNCDAEVAEDATMCDSSLHQRNLRRKTILGILRKRRSPDCSSGKEFFDRNSSRKRRVWNLYWGTLSTRMGTIFIYWDNAQKY
jgi:hypothetical protein